MPYDVVDKFEKEIAEYCGAKYGIAVSSCTNALFLSLLWIKHTFYADKEPDVPINIPHKTYIGVAHSIINAGWDIVFEEIKWKGSYQLYPYEIVDNALRFKKGMYVSGDLTCLSFHNRKHIPIGRGGMILTDDEQAMKWLKLARFDGRETCPLIEQKEFTVPGWNMYMTPEQAARGLVLFNNIKDKDLPDMDDYDSYPDLSKLEIFK